MSGEKLVATFVGAGHCQAVRRHRAENASTPPALPDGRAAIAAGDARA